MASNNGSAAGKSGIRRPIGRCCAGWSLALLASTALVAVPSALVPFGFGGNASANGGRSGGISNNGTGGISSATGAGGQGYNNRPGGSQGSGGGGAGTTGGAGGNTYGPVGGAGGSTAGAAGTKGQDHSGSYGAGGGGGGAHGYVGSTVPSAAVTGGAGAEGGAGDNSHGAGGGGAGGYGAVLTGAGSFTVGVTITGGAGGAGGSAGYGYEGGGGDGGYGLYIDSNAGVAVTISDGAVITGGAGGANGDGSTGGLGGVGITGDTLNLTLGSGATVVGGLRGGATTRANAITFTGTGANVLELIGNGGTSGQTYATITGDVVGASGFATNTLKFSGNGGVFDLSKFEAADTTSVQFRKFDTVSVASGLWIMTGSQANSNAVAGYKVDGGTLQLGSAGTAASIVGTINVNTGGTLTVGGAGATVSNAVKVNSGGTLDLAAISGRSALTLSGDKLELNSGGTFKVTLGAPTTTALVTISNDNLNVDGALIIASNGGLAEGTYSLVKYGGSGTGTFASITGPSDYAYSTSIDSTNKVLLLAVVNAGQYWNGRTTTGSGPLDGGTGAWTATSGGVQNWSNSGGTTHVVTDPTKKAIFAGSAGTVTVDASQGAVASKGLKFLTSGYEIAGAALTLATTSGAPQVEVVGSGTVATIGSPLAGTQGLEKIGAGTLVLTGANSYTGGTTITAGTLQIGNGGTSGAVTGDIANAAALVFDRSDDLTYAGTISGAGTIEKKGAGTLTLSGSTVGITGQVTISAGGLTLTGNQVQGMLTGDIVNNGALTIDRSTVSGLYSGVISGTGSLTKTGAENVFLTGTNTFTGGTFIQAGQITLGTGGAAGSLAGDVTIASGAGLGFYRSGALTYAGTLSGAGAWGLGGGLTLTLTGSSTTTGATSIQASTLQIGNGGTAGSITGDIQTDFRGANAGHLIFNRSDSVTYGGSISGIGTLEQKGTGTLVLTGANTHTGGTTVTAGTLQIGSGGTSGTVTGDIANAAALVFDRSDDSAYAGAISGVGTVEKTGAGTLTLTGNHTYSGDTTVSGGTLAFAGGASTINSAIVSIGKAAGTTGALSVTGPSTSVTFASTSVEQLRVGEGGNGALSVTGGATLTSFDTFIGVDTGSAGTVTVSGLGTKWDAGNGRVEVGYAGVGTVTVSDGATVTSGRTWVGLDTAGGTVTVTGANTTWNTGGNLFDVGSFGPGTLTISDGAVVTSLFESKIGDDARATGTATVTGTGSKWDLGTADLYVGNAGKGTLHVASGGTVTSGTAYISWNAYSTGSVTVDGTGSTWALTGGGTFTPSSLHVGYVGNGSLTVSNGGTVTSPLAAIGSQLGSVGTVTVTGTGSSLTIGNGTIYGGGLTVGDAGNGSLTVAAGATVSATYLTVANGNATQGDLTVTGAGSTLSLTDQIDVGYYGTARLTIADGGKLVGTSAAYVGYYSGSYLPAGSTAKVTSTATITGAGSNWDQSAGQIFLGFDAAGTVGTLLVEKGGTVASKGGTFGYLNGAEGAATVTGSGSTWTVGSDGLVIGDRASGSLTVADSGTVTIAAQVTIGNAAGSTGTVTVTGAGSSLTVAGTGLSIAQDGTGSLTVANGGTVTSAADISVGSNSGAIGTATVDGTGSRLVAGTNRVILANDSGVTSTLTVANGGSVEAGQLVKGNSGATVTLALDGGTLRATAAQADYLKGFAGGDAVLRSGGGTLDTNGFDVGVTTVLGGVGGLTKSGAGTLTLTGVNTFTGTTTIAAGTLQLSGGGSLAGALDAQAGTILTGDPTGATAGSVAGAVTVRDGATLAMRSGVTTLTLGSLTLGSAATVATTLLNPSTTAAVGIIGNLVLSGTLDLTAGTGFASGTYRLFDYGGSLSGVGLTLGMKPAHNLYAIDTATAGQVNLIVVQSQWWNGAGGSGTPSGGSGTWDAGTTANWTDATGSTSSTWKQGSLATFGGAAGTVTVAAGTAPQAAGLEFITSGYTLAGGPVTLVPFNNAPLARILVDDSTSAGGTATISAALTGSEGVEKTGPGTLILAGVNTYTGDTKVTAGALQIGAGGSLAGNVTVGSGAVLGGDPTGTGTGTVVGNVAVGAGGGLNLVTGTTTLSVGGALTLDPAASVSVLVLAPSTTAAAHVGGNLTLAGALDLTAGAGFGSGTYRLFDYGGTLSGAGLTLGSTPAHSLFAVDTGTTGQVNLVVAAGLWWNGSTTGAGGSRVAGGNGSWDVAAGTTNWTDAAGAAANAWSQGSLAIFGGAAGTVTVGTTAPQAAGLEFVTSGYTLTGGGIALASFHGNTTTRVLVDDGTASGGMTTIVSALSGSQTLEKTGAGTLVLTGANTYGGGTKVTAGTLQIGAGGNTGSVAGAIANSGTLVFDRADSLSLGGAVTGSGALVQRGSGTLTLTGSNSAGAGTTVAGGTLALASGAGLASDVTVQSGARLTARNAGVTPTVAGIVTVQAGATLDVAPAAGGDGLSTTGLVLTSNSHLAVTLGVPTGHTAVATGSLALDGVLDVTAGVGLMQGVYRIIDYTTLASDHGLQLGSTPTGFTYAIQRQIGQVNLAVAAVTNSGILYWNGPQTTANGTIQGGAGTWSGDPTRTNWTDTGATQSLTYQRAFAVFGGTGGTVSVDASKGALTVGGIQFTTGGYTLSGDAITLDDASGLTQVRVGDGTASGAGTVATIASSLAGPGGLVKTDLGTLVLSGVNTYAGDTQVKGGTLALAGQVDGDIYVYDQATLSGGGKVGKTVHVLDGGTLAGGPSHGLTMAGLDLAGKATLAVTLGAPGGTGIFQVNGDVTLGGTLAVTPGAGFGFGVYRIANYTGRLTNNGMLVGALPGGALGGLQTAVAQQVNLFIEDPNYPVAFWNGATLQPMQTVAGGSGTWSADPTTNWTNASGTINRRWPSAFAVFQGTAGTATVDNSAGAVTVSGIQFADSGFRVAGGALTLAGSGAVPIRVGDGTAAG